MKRTEFIKLVGLCLKENTGHDVYEVADKVLKILKDRKVISVDMTCDFCSERCLNNWCESSYEANKTE